MQPNEIEELKKLISLLKTEVVALKTEVATIQRHSFTKKDFTLYKAEVNREIIRLRESLKTNQH